MELVDYCFDTRYADIMSSRSGLYPREAFHRLTSPQTSFGVRSSLIHFSYERGAQFNLEWIFSKLDSGFLLLDSGFQSPGFRIPQAKKFWIPESGFPYMERRVSIKTIYQSYRVIFRVALLPSELFIIFIACVFVLGIIPQPTGFGISYLSSG